MRLVRLLALAGWLSLQAPLPGIAGASPAYLSHATPRARLGLVAACSSWEREHLARTGAPAPGTTYLLIRVAMSPVRTTCQMHPRGRARCSRSQDPHPVLTVPGQIDSAVGVGGPVIRRSLVIPGRIDSLLVLPSGKIAALVGSAASSIRFLPHDDLLRITLSSGARQRIPLPPYVVPPGLAVLDGGVAVVVDDVLLRVAGVGRVVTHRPLDMAAVGWPAAVTADTSGRLYLIGQEADAWSAQVEALSPLVKVLWRAPLGLTHAGIWVGMAGASELAAYLPDAHDAQGTLALLDTHVGRLRASYALPAAPLAIDPARGLLYLSTGGTIQTRVLATGRPLLTVPGAGPLALDSSSGRVAFMRGSEVVVADPKTLRTEAALRLPGVTALAFMADGKLLAGVGDRLDQIVV